MTLLLKYYWLAGLIMISAAAVFLRLFELGQLPSIMHRDELAIAYNAYSILETGRDEWGVAWPLAFKSFGDYKLPGMVYGTALGIKLFGLNQFGARFVAALLSALAVPLTYLFVKLLFKSQRLALLAALVLALSFWHLANARNIYEPVVCLTFTIPSYLGLFMAVKNKHYLWVSLFFFWCSIGIYNTALIIYPPLFFGWLIYNWRSLSANSKKFWILGLLLLLAITLSNIYVTRSVAGEKSQTTIFFNRRLIDENKTRLHRLWSSGVPLYPSLVNGERAVQIAHRFYQSYVLAVDPIYLFFAGGNNNWHNLQAIGFGDINPALLPLVIGGLIYLCSRIKQPANVFLLLLLALSPLPSAITIDSPNTNRLTDLHWVVEITAVLGGFFLIKQIRSKYRPAALVLVTTAYLLFTAQFLSRYFLIYNKTLHSDWNEGFAQLLQKINLEKNNYQQVIVDTQVSAMYIYYAFYTKYPPAQLQQLRPVPSQNFNRLDHIEQVYFGQIIPDPVTPGHGALIAHAAGEQLKAHQPLFIITNWENYPLWFGFELEE